MTLLYIFIALLAGLFALFLVSSELSGTLKLSLKSRIILGAMMGFGVIGVSIKAAVISYLTPSETLAMVSTSSRTLNSVRTDHSHIEPRGLSYRIDRESWRSLPVPKEELQDTDRIRKLIKLGERLFFDTRLSSSGSVSCASCHVIGLGGDDGKEVSTGIDGLKGDRNAPTVLNSSYLRRFFWDGRAASLEEQAKGPLVNPVEMGLRSLDQAVGIVTRDPVYVSGFKTLYSEDLNIDQIAKAIAAFERTLTTGLSPYDRFVNGDNQALSASELRGMQLFDEVGCRSCHEDPWFTVAGSSHTSPYRVFPVYQGSYLLERHDLTRDRGRNQSGVWRVPSLRNVAETAPYFHNGSVQSLKEAVQIMATVQRGWTVTREEEAPIRITRDQQGRPILKKDQSLGNQDVEDIVNFLKALSGDIPMITNPWR